MTSPFSLAASRVASSNTLAELLDSLGQQNAEKEQLNADRERRVSRIDGTIRRQSEQESRWKALREQHSLQRCMAATGGLPLCSGSLRLPLIAHLTGLAVQQQQQQQQQQVCLLASLPVR